MRRRFTLFAFAALAAGLCATSAAARPQQQQGARGEELPRGRLVERVATLADPAQSYALYLPSAYTRERAWPVLFCYDPLARGRVPVERFREAAERHGWIVVSSNNSRNGPLRPSLEAAQATWTDVYARFAVDARRVYAAGFSGGARLAVRLQYLCQHCLAGVVAFGAGFPTDIAPAAEAPFPLFAAAGTDDFNFRELKQLDARLARLSFPHRLALFEGGHAWPPSEISARAIEWLELRAMRAGRRARDEKLVEEVWARELARAAADEAAGRASEAYLGYRALAEDFEGLRDVTGAAEKAARLASSKEVRKALEDEGKQLRAQEQLYAEVYALLERSRGSEDDAMAAASGFRKRAADLRKAARAAEDTAERRVARRTLNELFANFYERAGNLRDRGAKPSQVVAELRTASDLAPDNPRVLFELACAYALNREKTNALSTLRRAVELGFDDADALATASALAPLRDDPAYKEIVERLPRKN